MYHHSFKQFVADPIRVDGFIRPIYCLDQFTLENHCARSKNLFRSLFQEKNNTFLAHLWRCSNYHSTHKYLVKQM